MVIKMQKIVINNCHGGFGLSEEALKLYKDRMNIKDKNFWDASIPRDSKTLVQIVQELGKKADGKYSELRIVEVPDEVDWQIDEYDGQEWVAEKHRTWRVTYEYES